MRQRPKKDSQQIILEFRKLQTRQIIAIAVALFIILLCAVLYKRPVYFGEFSKTTLFTAQLLTIGIFIGFTAANWVCPSCGKHLGTDIHRRVCRKCRARLV